MSKSTEKKLKKTSCGDESAKPQAGNASAAERQRFISMHLKTSGKLQVEALRARFPGLKSHKILEDLKLLNKVTGHDYRRIGNEIVDKAGSATQRLSDRAPVNGEEKSLAADLAVSMLLGFKKLPENENGAVERIYTEKEILHKLLNCSTEARNTAQRVRSVLLKHFAETSRIIALDDGTTTLCIAHKLRQFSVPVAATNLSYLTVCTNSRAIFNVLGDDVVEQIRAIVVGGQQIGRTSAIAGPLAEFFLRSAALLQFSVSVVGASSVNVDKGLAFSDTQEEAIIKGVLFSKSVLRVIVVDNNKFTGMRHGYAFCSIDPQFCDLFITNSPKAMDHFEESDEVEQEAQRQRIDEFPDLVKSIESRGIPVLVADSERTMKFPYEAPRQGDERE